MKSPFFSWATRAVASSSMSSFVPKWRHPVGQLLTQAGSSPSRLRSTQRVHFCILAVASWNFGMEKGQPVEQ